MCTATYILACPQHPGKITSVIRFLSTYCLVTRFLYVSVFLKTFLVLRSEPRVSHMLRAHSPLHAFLKYLLYLRDGTLSVMLTARFPRVCSAVTNGLVSSQGSRGEGLRLSWWREPWDPMEKNMGKTQHSQLAVPSSNCLKSNTVGLYWRSSWEVNNTLHSFVWVEVTLL